MTVTRFAPSPTGYLHIGGLRTALFSWLTAQHNKGEFLLRIEDTDMARNSEEATEAILKAFEWVGMNHDGEVIALWESGAILLYLAEKTGQLMPSDARSRAETQQWLMFQMGGLGPMFGQYGYFKKFAGKDIEDPRPRQRYIDESRRLLNVLESQLNGQDYIQSNHYTIADIAIFPWLRAVRDFYGAGEDFQMASYTNTMTYLERCLDRPAVKRGLVIPPTD